MNNYRQLLRSAPLLQHLKSLPESIQMLLQSSPERTSHSLLNLLSAHAEQYDISKETLLVNHLVLSSFLYTYLSEIYTSTAKNLDTFFSKNRQSLDTAETDHHSAVHKMNSSEMAMPSISTLAEDLPESKPQPEQASRSAFIRQEPTFTSNEHYEEASNEADPEPFINPKSSAIERQLAARTDQELVIRTELRQTSVGTLFQWKGSHYNRKSKCLRLIDHEPQSKTIAFSDEKTSEFVRHSLDDLVQAMLIGDLVHYKAEKTSKNYLVRSFSKILAKKGS